MFKRVMQLAKKLSVTITFLIGIQSSESFATTVLSRPIGEVTVESSAVVRCVVVGFDQIEINGFPHQIIKYMVREVLKGRGEAGQYGKFSVPGGKKQNTNQFFSVSGGIPQFNLNSEYIVFLKDQPVLTETTETLAESAPNVLVGWEAREVVYQDDGQRALKKVGNLAELGSTRSLSAQRLSLRHRGGSTDDYDAMVSEITRAAAE